MRTHDWRRSARTSSSITAVGASIRYWRDVAGEWQREDLVTEGRVPIPCLDVELTLDEIYDRVELTAVAGPESLGYEVDEYDADADE